MPSPHRTTSIRFHKLAALAALPLSLVGCRHPGFPETPAGYREYAYVSNGGTNTVSVLDLVYLRSDRTLQVGSQPSALLANPVRNEIYVVNTQSGSISVIDALANNVVATIPVHRMPVSIDVDPTGHRAFVSNSGSNSISVLDLDQRREIAEVPAEQPGKAHLSPDSRSLVVPSQASGSVSIFAVGAIPQPGVLSSKEVPLSRRAHFTGCPGADSTVILPDSSKAFVACSSAHQVMALNLAAANASWSARQDPSLTTDRLLTMVEVGSTPIHLALKPDGGEVFVSNMNSDSISEIATQTNDVGGTYMIGTKPVSGIVSEDNSRLFVSNSGDDSIGLYSIDDGKLVSSLHTGSGPSSLAFSADEHLLLAVDAHSGDVSVIRTLSKLGPNLFTILPAGSGPNAIVTKVVSRQPRV
ncbi:YncE family protein [Granulicella sibirica]|uniref:YncE family protein n=1 Tax=Granulicella sibirica TaxID=2479048 RepID=UPI001F4FCDFF|nr:YncE family protein [Granulicella sibirica]